MACSDIPLLGEIRDQGGKTMRPLSAGRSSSSEHACMTLIVQSMTCDRERVLVEDEEALKDLEVLFVHYCAPDTIVQLLVRKRAFGLKALVRKRRPSVNKSVGGISQNELRTSTYMSRCASSIGYCTIAKLTYSMRICPSTSAYQKGCERFASARARGGHG